MSKAKAIIVLAISSLVGAALVISGVVASHSNLVLGISLVSASVLILVLTCMYVYAKTVGFLME